MAPDNRFSLQDLWTDLAATVGRVRRVLPIIARRHKVMLLLALIIMLVSGALNTAVAVLFGAVVTRVADALKQDPGGAEVFSVAAPFLALIGGSYLLRELLLVGQRYLVQSACTRIERDITVVAVSHLLKGDLAVLAGERVGALQGRISRSVDALILFLSILFRELIPGLIAIACALIYVFVVDYRIGLVMLASLPVAMGLTLRQTSVQLATRRAILRARENLDGTVIERMGAIEYIRAADTGRQEVKHVEQVAEEQRQRLMHQQLSMTAYEAYKAINEGVFHLLVLGLAIYLVSRRATFPMSGQLIQPGDIVTYSMLFYRVVMPLKTLWSLLDNVQEWSLRVDDLLKMLAQPPDPSFSPVQSLNLSMMVRVAALYKRNQGPFPLPARNPQLVKGAPLIVITDLIVDYAAPSGRVKRALHGVSLTVAHGQMVGVAGPAGSGKSTWLKVLLRLTPPSAGQVFIGGVPLEQIDRETIGRLFGYVGQTPFVFGGTVMENLVYGHEDATPSEVRRAAELACIHDEIMAMPGAYQSRVAERGQNLSGGQRQRIALARVFLKNPPILLLDEATSALDNINEKAVKEALAATRADRTTVLVAHRLTTLNDADEILVFDKGRIVERGAFKDLEQAGGLFARLVHSAEQGHAADA